MANERKASAEEEKANPRNEVKEKKPVAYLLRMPADLHEDLKERAWRERKSLKAYMLDRLQEK